MGETWVVYGSLKMHRSKCFAQNVSLKMFRSKWIAQNGSLKVFRSRWIAQNVSLKMFRSSNLNPLSLSRRVFSHSTKGNPSLFAHFRAGIVRVCACACVCLCVRCDLLKRHVNKKRLLGTCQDKGRDDFQSR